MRSFWYETLRSEVVSELNFRAARYGRRMRKSADKIPARHSADMGPTTSFKDLLLRMPNIGEDGDFERPRPRNLRSPLRAGSLREAER